MLQATKNTFSDKFQISGAYIQLHPRILKESAFDMVDNLSSL